MLSFFLSNLNKHCLDRLFIQSMINTGPIQGKASLSMTTGRHPHCYKSLMTFERYWQEEFINDRHFRTVFYLNELNSLVIWCKLLKFFSPLPDMTTPILLTQAYTYSLNYRHPPHLEQHTGNQPTNQPTTHSPTTQLHVNPNQTFSIWKHDILFWCECDNNVEQFLNLFYQDR